MPEITFVIRRGDREARKDQYQPQWNAWNYAIRGKTVDGRDLRIVVSFDEDEMLLIITAIEIL